MNIKTRLALLLLIYVIIKSKGEEFFQDKEVAVIGGGIAGLAAARRIQTQDRSSFDVRVYEARRERYGGRVWTDKLKNPKARGTVE